MTIEVSAIVLNFNGGDWVGEAVRSLLDQDQPGLEVLVVDNASSDGSDRRLEERFGTRIRLLRAPRNLGFGGGNNIGLRAAGGGYLLLLNSDAEAHPSMARRLMEAARARPRVGMVAAKVLEHARRDVLDNTGHLLYPDGLNRGRGRLEPDRGQYDRCATALFPSGAAALYRREMLDDVGLFDESFFLYGDDAELGLRGRIAGWECAFAPDAVAYHHYSRSVGAYSTLKAFHVERNRVWVLMKLFPMALIVASPVYTAVRLGWQAWGALIGRGAAARLAREASPWRLASVTLRAWASAAGGLPRVWRERRRLHSRRRMSTLEFVRLLREFRLGAREVALRD
jgi:GT2 family glycosyltransferase